MLPTWRPLQSYKPRRNIYFRIVRPIRCSFKTFFKRRKNSSFSNNSRFSSNSFNNSNSNYTSNNSKYKVAYRGRKTTKLRQNRVTGSATATTRRTQKMIIVESIPIRATEPPLTKNSNMVI